MRLISPRQAKVDRSPTPGSAFQDYLERTAKFVPVEIIAAFIALRTLVPAHGSAGAIPTGAELAIYIALVVLTPLYFLKLGGDVPRKQLQVAITTVSFVVWSYAIGGPFFWLALEAFVGRSIVSSGLAAALLIIWSLFAGLVDPLSRPASGTPVPNGVMQ